MLDNSYNLNGQFSQDPGPGGCSAFVTEALKLRTRFYGNFYALFTDTIHQLFPRSVTKPIWHYLIT